VLQADKNAESAAEASGAQAKTVEPSSATSAGNGAAAAKQEPAAAGKLEVKTAQADTGSPQADAKAAQADAKPSTPSSATKSQPMTKPVRGPHLQAGVFLQATNAQTFKSNLEAQGFPVYIESRVHIGPFRDRKEAERAREKLREMGVTTVLIAQ
jgi:DedD protein